MIARLLVVALVAGCGPSEPPAPATAARKLVVFGVDGMDPALLRAYMREGRMPHLSALAERGGFIELGTSDPPQSPVAWSDFITGHDSSSHGIYDFVHRDPHSLEPYLSTSRVEPASTLEIGPVVVPLSSPEVRLLREGRTFWQDLEDAGVPATVVKVPANFPPAPSTHARSLSGMGTPDLTGTYGTFQLYTDDPALAGRRMSGGVVHRLTFDGQRARGRLVGPSDPLSPDGASMAVALSVLVDDRRPVALIEVGDHREILQPGEWSAWIPVAFDPGLLAGSAAGMVRLYLASVEPRVRLYVSPINLDPAAPAMPLSAPGEYASALASRVGRFYTQGMPLDTKALAGGALDDEELLSQADIVFRERLALLDDAIAEFDGGLLFFYFSLVDQLSHVFWRALDPDAPAEVRRHARVIPDIYQRVDTAIGDAISRLGDDVDIIVLSDHGFAPFKRKVHLNTWLANRGYLSLLDQDQVVDGPLGHIDWNQTQAYGLGLNQLFLNLRGRERGGVVDPGRRALILDRLERDLLAWRDPDSGTPVVTRVTRPEPGQFAERAPDLIVGYNRGYRSSDESALGQVGNLEVEDNRGVWSGDHCMDPSHVPGVLLASLPVRESGSLTDMAPTLLAYFDVAAGAPLPGDNLLVE